MTIGNDIHGFIAVALFAAIAHEPWRWLGALLGSRVRETDDVFLWVRYVSSALVAALAMRFVFFPSGALATIEFPIRFLAMAAGVTAFIAFKRNLAVGIFAGAASLVGLGLAAQQLGL